jgi:serine/threonine protein kinase
MPPPKPPIPQADDSDFKVPELPASVRMKYEPILMEFLRGWQRGKVTPIEKILTNTEGDERAYLLWHLLREELEYRSHGDEQPASSEYERRFPQDRPLVRKAFKELVSDEESADPFAETSSFNNEASGTDVSTAACPECHEQIDTKTIEPGIVKCNQCGSAFVYTPVPSVSGSGMVLPSMIGRYRIVGLLGSGAFGTVYKAEDTELKNIVALKFPQHWDLYSKEAKSRFQREAKAAAALEHENIVRVLNIGRLNDVPYIVSSFIDGPTLAEILAGREEPLPLPEAVTLIRKIAEALHYAHENQVIHRDVKPGNILVDHTGRPFLADFGLARWEGDDVTVTRDKQFLGTWAYASPEQAMMQNTEIDGRSDIFSLGIVLYEMLTGKRPFQGKTISELERQICHVEPQAPRQRNAKIPRDLETICLKCLEKSPDKRYQTAGELAKDLQRVLDEEPIKARRVSPLERGWRWGRKNPSRVGLALLIIISSLIVSYDQMIGSPLRRLEALKTRADDIKGVFLTDDVEAIFDLANAKTQLPPGAVRQLTSISEKNEQFLLDGLNSYFPSVSDKAVTVCAELQYVTDKLETQLHEMSKNHDGARNAYETIRSFKESVGSPDD